jgi:hypothetical protein
LLAKPELLVCPRGPSREISRKGRRFRELQTLPIGLKQVFLVTEAPQGQCRSCGHSLEIHPPLPRPTAVPRGRSGISSQTCADS